MCSENPWGRITLSPSCISESLVTCGRRTTPLFVACRMISDPKSAQFISWTELGTSFVVSNVGEFSRSILGSHFKHNNVSWSHLA
jgi:hypothetical protein